MPFRLEHCSKVEDKPPPFPKIFSAYEILSLHEGIAPVFKRLFVAFRSILAY